ncbi:MAG: GDP-L-fucose synthase, partial [Bacteroidota bacterium]
DISIKNVALLIKEVVGYQGELQFDTSKPNGTPRKLMNVDRLHTIGFQASIGLKEGLASVYQDFLANHARYTARA